VIARIIHGAALMVLVCGCAPAAAPGSAASSPILAATPSTLATLGSAVWPPGVEVPAELAGVWFFPLHDSRITLAGTRYTVDQSSPVNHASGNVVVNGSEIAFFNGDRCGLPLPRGLGRYRWTQNGSELHFTAVNADPCGRVDILAGATWTRRSSG
jgi:hypothetical protein